jgi:hypothetical protein
MLMAEGTNCDIPFPVVKEKSWFRKNLVGWHFPNVWDAGWMCARERVENERGRQKRERRQRREGGRRERGGKRERSAKERGRS